jgi:hypothetical protein
LFGAHDVWVQWTTYYALLWCTDGLIDTVMGSTATVMGSNSYFTRHDVVMQEPGTTTC